MHRKAKTRRAISSASLGDVIYTPRLRDRARLCRQVLSRPQKDSPCRVFISGQSVASSE